MALTLYDLSLQSRLILGTALYHSIDEMLSCIAAAKVDMVTVGLKRELNGGKDNRFWQAISATGCHLLPNTAGCRTAKEAIMIANAAREIFSTEYIKLEVIGDDLTLYPHGIELIKATKELIAQGFKVLPYCPDDYIICEALVEAGCKVLMPLASYIGSGQGLVNMPALRLLRTRFNDITLIIDAGIGAASDAVKAMELGFDGILLNSAVALAQKPKQMAEAFHLAIKSGRLAYDAGVMPKRELAHHSTPLADTPFWHQ
ncbi:MAG: thiazole synthase [Francisellaceae bacterium]